MEKKENKKLLEEQTKEISGGCPPPYDPPAEQHIAGEATIKSDDASKCNVIHRV